MKRIFKQGVTIGILLSMLLTLIPVNAQSARSLNCGDIVEGETSASEVYHEYQLAVSAGTTINVTIEPLGSTFNVASVLLDSGGSEFAGLNLNTAGIPESFENLIVGSSNPSLRVFGSRPDLAQNNTYRSGTWAEYFGAYIVSLGCVLRDGTVINPGDTLEPIDNNSSQPPTFSGVGFPGLASMDFINGVTIPFTHGMPNTGSVSPGFDSVFGFTLDINAGETYTFDFNRVSGNLNLAIAILSPDNQIVFYGGMITSDRLSTDVLFPAAGQYTIGVYRVDFMPPETPENTAFQVTATLQ